MNSSMTVSIYFFRLSLGNGVRLFHLSHQSSSLIRHSHRGFINSNTIMITTSSLCQNRPAFLHFDTNFDFLLCVVHFRFRHSIYMRRWEIHSSSRKKILVDT